MELEQDETRTETEQQSTGFGKKSKPLDHDRSDSESQISQFLLAPTVAESINLDEDYVKTLSSKSPKPPTKDKVGLRDKQVLSAEEKAPTQQVTAPKWKRCDTLAANGVSMLKEWCHCHRLACEDSPCQACKDSENTFAVIRSIEAHMLENYNKEDCKRKQAKSKKKTHYTLQHISLKQLKAISEKDSGLKDKIESMLRILDKMSPKEQDPNSPDSPKSEPGVEYLKASLQKKFAKLFKPKPSEPLEKRPPRTKEAATAGDLQAAEGCVRSSVTHQSQGPQAVGTSRSPKTVPKFSGRKRVVPVPPQSKPVTNHIVVAAQKPGTSGIDRTLQMTSSSNRALLTTRRLPKLHEELELKPGHLNLPSLNVKKLELVPRQTDHEDLQPDFMHLLQVEDCKRDSQLSPYFPSSCNTEHYPSASQPYSLFN